jgi:hypothetical protein
MDSQEKKDANSIRHFKGSVKQFKQMFDDLADGKNTNAYDTPAYQGFDEVHPVRGEVKSPHWDEVEEEEEAAPGYEATLGRVLGAGLAENHIPSFKKFLNENAEEKKA